MNSPIQWFLLLLCDRRTAPTLFSTLAWYPPVGGTRRIGKDSPVHRPDGLRPSRRRITACDQRFEGYPSMLACYIRRAAGTHEYLYYDSSGQRRAGPQLTGLGTSCALYFSSPPNAIFQCVAKHTPNYSPNAIFPGMRRKKGTPHSRCPRGDYVTRGAPPRRLHYVSFHHIRFCVICFQHILVLFHIRWEPLATRPLCRITLPLSALSIIAKPPSRNARPGFNL